MFFSCFRFYLSYKELKLCNMSPFHPVAQSVFIFPIRNWNFLSIRLYPFLGICFYLSYKELKHFFNFCNCIFTSEVFIFPIRNWNVGGFFRLSFGCKSFYLSYKELKLLLFPLYIFLQLLCFYLSYKELKRYNLWYIRYKKNQVFIFPIRNWNIRGELIPPRRWNGFYLSYKELKLIFFASSIV